MSRAGAFQRSMVLTVLILLPGLKSRRSPDLERARLDAARQNAAVVEAIDILDWEPQRLVRGRLGQLKCVQRFQHGRPLPPRHVRAARGDVVAVPGRDRNEALGAPARRICRKARYSALDLLEPRLVVAFQVHFVHQHGDLADAQQIQQVAVAARVLLHAFVGVNQQQRGFGPRPRR